MKRYVFITGGVVSSLGKGLAAAALGSLLQLRGYRVRLRKLDPYLNVDPGTMSPYQHGEVFVTDDGAETDLDLGHYERFTGVPARASDTVSARDSRPCADGQDDPLAAIARNFRPREPRDRANNPPRRRAIAGVPATECGLRRLPPPRPAGHPGWVPPRSLTECRHEKSVHHGTGCQNL